MHQDAKFTLHETQPVVSQSAAMQNARIWSYNLSAASAKLASMVDRPGLFGTEDIKTCIENVDKSDRPTLLNGGTTPVLFYAIKQGCITTIKLLLLQGADCSHKLPIIVGSRSKVSTEITPLMFAIMSAPSKPYLDNFATIKLLLAFDATLSGIPKELTQQEAASTDAVKALSKTLPEMFLLSKLNDHLQPVFRYWIQRARRLGASSPRELQMVKEHGLESLKRANFYEIGQEPACKRIQQEILSRLLIPTESRGPLIMAFAGEFRLVYHSVDLHIHMSLHRSSWTRQDQLGEGHGRVRRYEAHCNQLCSDRKRFLSPRRNLRLQKLGGWLRAEQPPR